MLWSCGRQGGFDLQKWQLQRLVYSSVPSYQLIKAKHKHSQLLLHLLSRHNPKTGRKRTRKLIFPAVGGARCTQDFIISRVMPKKVGMQNSEVELHENTVNYVGLNREGNTGGALSKPCSQKWSKDDLHSVWRDSFSSAHPRHSRQGPSGAASSQSRSVCTNTRNTTRGAAHPCKQ